MATLIRGARVVGPHGVSKGDIRIENGRIAGIGRLRKAGGATVIHADGLVALPGFVDLHVHGGAGFEFCAGQYDPRRKRFDRSATAFRKLFPLLMKRFARTGVTRALLATFAAPIKTLEAALVRLADYAESDANGRDGARLEGAFLEAPFIKNAAYAGAQNPRNFLPPSLEVYERLRHAARGHIRYVNVVPEYGASAERLIRRLTRDDVLVGLGHSFCDADQVARCERLGLRVAVHFLNGPTGTSFKPFHGGNVLEAVLRSDAMYAEIIGDGRHVAPPYVMDVVRRKGTRRVVAVTDASFAAGMQGLTEFRLGGRAGKVHKSGQYLHTKRDPMTLFGSMLDMATAFSNLLSWFTKDMAGVWYRRHPARKLERALVETSRMCSTTPARLLGPGAGGRGTGVLARGKTADIVLADLRGSPGNWKLKVKQTFVEGRPVL